MTNVGWDYAWDHPSVAQLQAAGTRFVMRYLSWDPSKNLTPTELATYEAAGIEVGLNWEYDTHACQGGYNQGHADAVEAKQQATALGLPVDDDHPIYFSSDDYDIQLNDRGGLISYLHGASDALGGKMRVGHYGGYNGTLWAYQSGYCGWLWQTYAWSGDRWLNVNIRQVAVGTTLNGHDVDKNQAMTDNIGTHGGDDMFSDNDRKLLTTVAAELDKALNLKDGGWPLPNLLRQIANDAATWAATSVDAKAVATELAAQVKSDPTFAQLLAQALAADPQVAASFQNTLTNSLKGVSVTSTTSLGA